MPDGSPVFDADEIAKYGRFPGSPDLPAGVTVDAATPPSEGGTAIVGSYPPNAWGLYDMLGNVMEMCLDAWQTTQFYDPSIVHVDPVGPYETANDLRLRVVRGGHWNSAWPLTGRSFVNINHNNGDAHTKYMGFRVCLTLP
jgi:formylglycine-generating enzyme required for sulfatase activity